MAQEYKEILVAPLAAGREVLALFGLISLIILGMWLRYNQLKPDVAANSLPGYQLVDLQLKNQEPTLYRALLGAVGDILYLREENGTWPDVELLAGDSLPPFAPDFLPSGLRGFTWKRHASKGWVDYFGTNTATKNANGKGQSYPLKSSFILRIIDFDNGKNPYPYYQLDDQSFNRFSAQVWRNTQTVDYPAGDLVKRGWKWIVSPESESGTLVAEPGGQ